MKTYKQLENEHFVFVDNKFFTKEYQEQYGIESILILALIQKNLLIRGQYVFNLQYLFDCLGVKSNNSTQQRKIKDCLVQLQEDSIISSDVDVSKANNNQLIYVDIDIPETDYTAIYDFELDAIANYKEENVYNLFNLFTFLKYRIGLKGYCYWGQTDIAYSIGLKSRKVVSRMVDVLEKELKLILVDNAGTKKFKDGTIKESNNMYAMNYEGSKELLKLKKKEYKEELKEDGIRITKNKTANDKRRMMALINHRRAKYYDDTITDAEYKELEKYEKEYYNMIKNDEDTLEEKKDDFVTIDIDGLNSEIEEPKGHFGTPNPSKGLTETGGILDNGITFSDSDMDKITQDWLDSLQNEEYEKQDGESALDVFERYKPDISVEEDNDDVWWDLLS